MKIFALFAIFLVLAASDLIASNPQKGYYYDVVQKKIVAEKVGK